MSRIISSLSEISHNYDALFVDLWGCIHNGLRPFEDACLAMKQYRADGGKVVFVTNAPRHRGSVADQLKKIGVSEECWDSIATSGDSARSAMYRGMIGSKVYFIGNPATDMNFFDPLEIIQDPVDITTVPLAEADGIVCTGPFDAMADPAVNRSDFLVAKQMGLKLLCANPDIVVDRGETREWCAGALAKLYTEMGGESLYFGKPHPPIYDLARRRLAALGTDIPDSRILCIGDGIFTDIQGAVGEDIDSLFITAGLAAAETETVSDPNPKHLQSYLTKHMMEPTFSIGFLR
ncbi:MAG: TIGR01459 family HAD-type hydrolase [Pseudoruegeria sp.]